MKTIELGDKVKDRVTNYTGIVIAITRWMTGCDRAVVQAQELKDGKPVESQSFDVTMLEIIEKGAVLVDNKYHREDRPEVAPVGGPRAIPSRGR